MSGEKKHAGKGGKERVKWLTILLGVVTATGGFLDAGTISTSGAAGALFGLGLIWVVLIATLAAILLVEMSGRLAAVAGRPYGGVIRERFGFSFYLLPLGSELIAETLLLAAEIGGVSIAISLVTGLNWRLLFPFVALGIWILLWRSPFSVIENGPAIIGALALATIAALAPADAVATRCEAGRAGRLPLPCRRDHGFDHQPVSALFLLIRGGGGGLDSR
jgi:Mn2+/Fe2+ NRAMP family transporter